MKIVILGAGQVGSTLAADLSDEKHDVTVVDNDPEKLQALQERLDILTVLGRASYPEVLTQAGLRNADMLIAVTDSDEVNIIACLVSYALFSVPVKIARIHSAHYFLREIVFTKNYKPVDIFITPEQLITKATHQIIECPGALQVLDFAEGAAKLIVTKIKKSCFLVGRPLSIFESTLPGVTARIVAIFRKDQFVSLENSTHLEEGDELFFIAACDDVTTIMTALHEPIKPYKRIMIVGCGQIGTLLAESLQMDYHLKVIEQSREQCEMLSKKLNERVTILHGSADDQELLRNENIEDIDVFIAMTDDDEDNIMSCLQAKRFGARYTMAIIKRNTYAEIIEGNGIDVVISPHQIMVGDILTYIRKIKMTNLYVLRRGSSELVEIIAIHDKRVSDINMPKGAIIGALFKNKILVFPDQKTMIEKGDHVLVFVSDKKNMPNIERLFF